VQRIAFFASKDGVDIPGLGEARVQLLVDHGLVRTVADIYQLPSKQQELQAVPGFGPRLVASLCAGIEQARDAAPERVLTALSIPLVGFNKALLLLQHFNTLSSLFAASVEQLLAVPGVGEVMADGLIRWVRSNQELVDDLRRANVTALIAPPQQPTAVADVGSSANGSFVNSVVCFTGSFRSLSRDEAADRVRQAGGRVSNTLSRKTTFLVAGDGPGDGNERMSSKRLKAAQLHVTVVNEAEFIKMLEAR